MFTFVFIVKYFLILFLFILYVFPITHISSPQK